MAKKQTVFHTYIDAGKIKIISHDGTDFEKEINNLNYQIEEKSAKSKVIAIIGLITLGVMVSQLFGIELSKNQNILFGVSTIGIFLYALNLWERVGLMTRRVKSLNLGFNLAKKQLQNEILELEKKLVVHNLAIDEIALKNKFNFSNNFKKNQLQKEN